MPEMADGFEPYPHDVEVDGIDHPVFACGFGPPVILVHELGGVTDEILTLARDITTGGYRVYLPVLFGAFPQNPTSAQLLSGVVRHVCLSREFHAFSAQTTSPVADWLRALCAHVAGQPQHRDHRVGVIGMCLTGGFVLTMMVECSVGVGVVCQPTLPFVLPWPLPLGLDRQARWSVGASRGDVQQAQTRATQGAVPLLALRYEGDALCPRERIEQLQEDFPGAAALSLRHTDRKYAHATLTIHRSREPFHALMTFLHQHL